MEEERLTIETSAAAMSPSFEVTFGYRYPSGFKVRGRLPLNEVDGEGRTKLSQEKSDKMSFIPVP